MKSTRYCTTNNNKKIVLAVACAVVLLIGYLIGTACASDAPISCWVLCKPGAQVNVRRTPDKGGQVVGFLEVGDEFKTSGESRNGWIRVKGIGEYGEAWIYCGFVVTEKPELIGETYVCVAKNRVAIRKWVNGPQLTDRPWLKNGSTVQVFHIADGWACTSAGYIKAEWLEEDHR